MAAGWPRRYARNPESRTIVSNASPAPRFSKAEVHGYIEKLMEVTDKAETLETIDVLVDDNYAVGIIRVRFERAGKKPLEGQRVTVFKLAGGKIHDIWVRDEDQYAVDEFFS